MAERRLYHVRHTATAEPPPANQFAGLRARHNRFECLIDLSRHSAPACTDPERARARAPAPGSASLDSFPRARFVRGAVVDNAPPEFPRGASAPKLVGRVFFFSLRAPTCQQALLCV